MQIDYVLIKNYRQYPDQKIELFCPNKDKNFCVIEGQMGAGKSNLLNAVTWCLFGVEPHLSLKNTTEKNYVAKGSPMISEKTLYSMSEGDIEEVRVEIQMIDNDSKRHLFSRKLRFRKIGPGKAQSIPDTASKEKNGSTFEYWRQEGNDFKPLPAPRDALEQVIPEDTMGYFFFNGERLQYYFQPGSGKKVKDAVFNISQISLIERAIDRLESRKADFYRIHKDLSPRTKELEARKEKLSKELEDRRKDLSEAEEELEKAKLLEAKINEELQTYGPESAGVQRELQKLREAIESKEKSAENYSKLRINSLIKMAPYILALRAIDHTKHMVDDAIERGKYPPDVKKDFIESLLRDNVCICGSSLHDQTLRQKIELLLQTVSKRSEVSNEITSMQGSLGEIITEVKPFFKNQLKLDKDLKEVEDRLEEYRAEERVLEKKLEKSPEERIRELKSLFDRTKRKREDLDHSSQRLIYDIENIVKELKDCEAAYHKELAKAEQARELVQVIDFLDDALEAAETIQKEIAQEVRENVQKLTKEQFLKIIWNPERYSDVVINENFDVFAVKRISNEPELETLSSGQQHVLALAFTAALRNISGFEAPIIIDTPLGRISGDPKLRIAENLANYLPGCQVIMLATDEEYTPQVRSRLKDRMQHEYRIVLSGSADYDSVKVVPYE